MAGNASYDPTISNAVAAPAVVVDADVAAPVVDVDTDLDGFTVDAGDLGLPITANFDTGHNHGDIIADGTTYNGLKFETDHDLGMYYDNNKGSGGTKCLYDNAVNPGDILWLSITMSDFSDFSFDSIWIGATGGNTTITARGYLDEVQVELSEDISVSFDGSHNFNWTRVDEVRFEGATDLFSCFDDFTYVSYGLESAPPISSPPIADAGPDQAVTIGQLVNLDGSGSTDADGDVFTYAWSADSGNPATGLLSDLSAVDPSFTPSVGGTYTFTLVVNDGTLDSSPDEVTITVEAETLAQTTFAFTGAIETFVIPAGVTSVTISATKPAALAAKGVGEVGVRLTVTRPTSR